MAVGEAERAGQRGEGVAIHREALPAARAGRAGAEPHGDRRAPGQDQLQYLNGELFYFTRVFPHIGMFLWWAGVDFRGRGGGGYKASCRPPCS